MCQDNQRIKEMFEEYGFKITNNISLSTDLPYWGQSGAEVEQICGYVCEELMKFHLCGSRM